MSQRFYIETLGCPKNQVDSDKLIGTLLADGMQSTDDVALADLVVVNTCAFIDEARKESIDTILAIDEQRAGESRLVVTGCMAERYGDELAEALPEVDQVAGFGVPVHQPNGAPRSAGKQLIPVTSAPLPELDLLNLPRPKSTSPWAYVKIAEGCDRTCGFCAIPSFRGPQRSRDISQILTEVDELEAREIVLVAQDLASYGKDRPDRVGGRLDRAARASRCRTRRLGAVAVPLPERPDRRADRRDVCDGRALLRPVAPARQQAVAAPDAPMGRRRTVPRSDRRHPKA